MPLLHVPHRRSLHDIRCIKVIGDITLLSEEVFDLLEILTRKQLSDFQNILKDLGLRAVAEKLDEWLNLAHDFLQIERSEQTKRFVSDFFLQKVGNLLTHLLHEAREHWWIFTRKLLLPLPQTFLTLANEVSYENVFSVILLIGCIV